MGTDITIEIVDAADVAQRCIELLEVAETWYIKYRLEVQVATRQAVWPDYTLYIAYKEGRIIAVSTLTESPKAIKNYVQSKLSTAYQICCFAGTGEGGGRAIMEAYLSKARNEGAGLIASSVPSAVGFYKKFDGYRLPKHRCFVWDNVV